MLVVNSRKKLHKEQRNKKNPIFTSRNNKEEIKIQLFPVRVKILPKEKGKTEEEEEIT